MHFNSCPGKTPPKLGLHACDSLTVDPAPNEQAVRSGGDSMSGLPITHITDSFTVDPAPNQQAERWKWW